MIFPVRSLNYVAFVPPFFFFVTFSVALFFSFIFFGLPMLLTGIFC